MLNFSTGHEILSAKQWDFLPSWSSTLQNLKKSSSGSWLRSWHNLFGLRKPVDSVHHRQLIRLLEQNHLTCTTWSGWKSFWPIQKKKLFRTESPHVGKLSLVAYRQVHPDPDYANQVWIFTSFGTPDCYWRYPETCPESLRNAYSHIVARKTQDASYSDGRVSKNQL